MRLLLRTRAANWSRLTSSVPSSMNAARQRSISCSWLVLAFLIAIAPACTTWYIVRCIEWYIIIKGRQREEPRHCLFECGRIGYLDHRHRLLWIQWFASALDHDLDVLDEFRAVARLFSPHLHCDLEATSHPFA